MALFYLTKLKNGATLLNIILNTKGGKNEKFKT